jgi:hypothetical protein
MSGDGRELFWELHFSFENDRRPEKSGPDGR